MNSERKKITPPNILGAGNNKGKSEGNSCGAGGQRNFNDNNDDVNEFNSGHQNQRMELRKGMILCDRYKLDSKLGSGAMGVVWKAVDTELGNRPVAMKFLPEENLKNSKDRKRFKQTSDKMLRLKSKYLCGFIDYKETTACGPVLIMNFVHGVNLADYLVNHELTLEAKLEILSNVAKGLDDLHESGIVHCDLKPSNIMIHELKNNKLSVELIDFGLAAHYKNSGSVVISGPLHNEVVGGGTLAYMAPEQLKHGEICTNQTDIYALGCIAYELFAGYPPFGTDTRTLQNSHMNVKPYPIKNLSASINQVLLRSLSKSPVDRQDNGQEFFHELQNSFSSSTNSQPNPWNGGLSGGTNGIPVREPEPEQFPGPVNMPKSGPNSLGQGIPFPPPLPNPSSTSVPTIKKVTISTRPKSSPPQLPKRNSETSSIISTPTQSNPNINQHKPQTLVSTPTPNVVNPAPKDDQASGIITTINTEQITQSRLELTGNVSSIKTLYIVNCVINALSLVALMMAFLAIIIYAANPDNQSSLMITGLSIISNLLFVFISGIVMLVLYYITWSGLRYNNSKLQPWAAILLLFAIPYNIYWIFRFLHLVDTSIRDHVKKVLNSDYNAQLLLILGLFFPIFLVSMLVVLGISAGLTSNSAYISNIGVIYTFTAIVSLNTVIHYRILRGYVKIDTPIV